MKAHNAIVKRTTLNKHNNGICSSPNNARFSGKSTVFQVWVSKWDWALTAFNRKWAAESFVNFFNERTWDDSSIELCLDLFWDAHRSELVEKGVKEV